MAQSGLERRSSKPNIGGSNPSTPVLGKTIIMNLNKKSLYEGVDYLVLTALDDKYCEHIFATIKEIRNESIIFHSISENSTNIAIRLKNNICSFYTSRSDENNRNAELKGLIEIDNNSEYYVVKLEYEDYSKVNILKPSLNTPMDLNQNPQKIMIESNKIGTFNINMEQDISRIRSIIYGLIDDYNIDMSKLSDATLDYFYNMYSVECERHGKEIQEISGFKIVSYEDFTIRKN